MHGPFTYEHSTQPTHGISGPLGLFQRRRHDKRVTTCRMHNRFAYRRCSEERRLSDERKVMLQDCQCRIYLRKKIGVLHVIWIHNACQVLQATKLGCVVCSPMLRNSNLVLQGSKWFYTNSFHAISTHRLCNAHNVTDHIVVFF